MMHRLGYRGLALTMFGAMFAVIGVGVLANPAQVPTLLHTMLPLELRVTLWVAAGVIGLATAWCTRCQIAGFTALFVPPAIRFCSYGWALFTEPNLGRLAGTALYFSRAPIPYTEDHAISHAFVHIGLYVYRRETLLRLARLPRGILERAESLEQLRALEHGIRIHVVESAYESFEVNTPEDLERARLRVAGGDTARDTERPEQVLLTNGSNRH